MTEHKKIELTPRDYDVPGYREMIADLGATMGRQRAAGRSSIVTTHQLEALRTVHVVDIRVGAHAGLSQSENAALFRLSSNNSVAQTIRGTEAKDARTLVVSTD